MEKRFFGARRKAWGLGENKKLVEMSEYHLDLGIETLEKVSGTWENGFGSEDKS